MKCSEFAQLLDNYANLDQKQLDELEQHAAECDKCREELEFFRMITETTASLASPIPPSDLIDKINDRIDNEPKQRIFVSVMENIRVNLRHYAMVAACLVVGVIVGLNSKMMNERISGTDNDGIIKSEIHTSENGTDQVSENGTGSVSGPVLTPQLPEPTASTDKDHSNTNTVIPETDNSVNKGRSVAESSAPVPARNESSGYSYNVPQRAALATAQPETQQQSAANDVQYTQPAMNADNITAASATTETVPEQSNDVYTVERDGYHLPEETQETVSEGTVNEVESYSLAQNENTEEYGYSVQNSDVSPDQLAVSYDDADRVISILSEFSIENNGEACIASSADFDVFLSELDAEGIEYNYIPRGGAGDTVVFRIALI